jgi:uncharacterized membrane protein
MAAEEVAGRTGVPTSLLVLVPLVIVVGFVLVPTVARAVFGISLILFIPGFTMVYALFRDREIDDVERVALSVGLSICLSVFAGLLLNYTPGGLSTNQIVVSLCGVSGVFTAVGYYRRRD